jgi:hypothetical protein
MSMPGCLGADGGHGRAAQCLGLFPGHHHHGGGAVADDGGIAGRAEAVFFEGRFILASAS